MSGRNTRTGFEVFSLVGNGNVPRRATRRERANAALIRHRQRRYPNMDTCHNQQVWADILGWRLSWENEIYSYRDGNRRKDNDDD